MPSGVIAGTFDDIGFTQLQDELGNQTPTGAGVSVAQSEAEFGLGTDAHFPDSNIANPTNPLFMDTDFVSQSGPHGFSNHAQNVGRNFYSTDSIAPGITDVKLFTASGWLNGDFLQTSASKTPNSIDARVANHSWVAAGADSTMNKMDWVVNTDDFIQVVGVNNDPNVQNPGIKDGLAGAMNVIAVGLMSGQHESGTTAVSNQPYTAGRVRPHLVVDTNGFSELTSFSTPMVAAAATLLIETGRNPALSNGTIQSSEGRQNYTLFHAETSEVIRSALMAGANRQAAFANGTHTYARTSSNGLDSHFGAGELNVYNSYHIIAAGEQDNRQDGNLADVKIYGFDYDTIDLKAFSPAEEKSYRFTIGEGTPREFAATLSWNLQFSSVRLDSGRLDNLDLAIYELDLGDNGSRSLVQSSFDTKDATENLYISDLGPGTYELVVSAPTSTNTTLDYGLSWRFMADDALMGDVDLDGKVGLSDLLQLKKNLNASQSVLWTDGDIDGNGIVDEGDLSLLLENYGKVSLDVESSPQLAATAVPEPSTIVLCILAIAMLGITRFKRMQQR